MSAESGLLGIAVGMAVGMLAWVVGLGEIVWPGRSEWVLLLIIVGVAIVSAMILERNERRNARGARI